MEQSRGGRKRKYDGNAIEPHRRPWMLAFTKDVLEEIRATHVLPCDILQTVADYAFDDITIHLRVQKDLDRWPFKDARPEHRLPLEDINLKLSDTLLDIRTAFERIRPKLGIWTGTGTWDREYLHHVVLTSAWSDMNLVLTVPKLHLQIGEALFLIGVTRNQLQECLNIVHLKLKYMRLNAIE
jgi:hypothetical protein